MTETLFDWARSHDDITTITGSQIRNEVQVQFEHVTSIEPDVRNKIVTEIQSNIKSREPLEEYGELLGIIGAVHQFRLLVEMGVVKQDTPEIRDSPRLTEIDEETFIGYINTNFEEIVRSYSETYGEE